MTVQECYEKMDGDYIGVSERLLQDDRIKKYLIKFAQSQDYKVMLDALDRQDYEVAFRASHSLKGLSLNLGFTGLQEASSLLCETLRGGDPHSDIKPLLEDVDVEYNKVVSAIKML